VGINKQDLYSEELVIAIKKLFALHKQEIIIFSAATKSGIDKLLDAFSGLLGQGLSDCS